MIRTIFILILIIFSSTSYSENMNLLSGFSYDNLNKTINYLNSNIKNNSLQVKTIPLYLDRTIESLKFLNKNKFNMLNIEFKLIDISSKIKNFEKVPTEDIEYFKDGIKNIYTLIVFNNLNICGNSGVNHVYP
jgi:hypothetical protein